MHLRKEESVNQTEFDLHRLLIISTCINIQSNIFNIRKYENDFRFQKNLNPVELFFNKRTVCEHNVQPLSCIILNATHDAVEKKICAHLAYINTI